MKKLITLLALVCISASVFAHGYRHNNHGYYHHGYHNNWNWVVPATVGGLIVYQATRPIEQPVIVQPQVIVQDANSNCTPWIETQNSDGSITRTRTCR